MQPKAKTQPKKGINTQNIEIVEDFLHRHNSPYYEDSSLSCLRIPLTWIIDRCFSYHAPKPIVRF